MAVRGVLTAINFFPANRAAGAIPLFAYQNHFPESKTIDSRTYLYKAFQSSPISSEKDASIADVSITFPSTASNIDLLTAALTFRQEVEVFVYRWSAVQGIDNPSSYELFAAFAGAVKTGSMDLSTMTITIGEHNDSVGADLPWRKIPWTILGPLSFRR
jgi:hypothetical protein